MYIYAKNFRGSWFEIVYVINEVWKISSVSKSTLKDTWEGIRTRRISEGSLLVVALKPEQVRVFSDMLMVMYASIFFYKQNGSCIWYSVYVHKETDLRNWVVKQKLNVNKIMTLR